MPQLLPAAAAWAAAAWTSAVTVTAGALASVGVVGAIGEGATIALAGSIVQTGVTLGISAAATAIMRPSTPSSGTTLDFKPDPKAPVRGAMGYTALGGNKAFQATWGYNRVAMSLGVALSLGPIDSITQFQADGAPVTFAGPQSEATGFYAADMWQKTTLGLPSDAALLPPTGLKYGNPGLTGWGSQHAAPQVAFAFWTMVLAKNPEDRDIFTNGVPDPRWVGRWMKVWNPRLDSTYPGGSGPQRRDDWRTWAWSENPYVHALAWVRGHYKLNTDGSIDRTKRIAGVGAPDSAIDIPAFVEGMNVADINGWTISGEWSTSDQKWQVLLAMLQAGGGQPINRGAQISVLVNMPRVSTYTYTKADLIGQATIKPLTPRRDRKNTIIPRYKSPAHNWEYVAAGEVTAATYRTEDRGEPRSTEVEYKFVRDARQAGQLAAYDLVNLREGLTVTLPSKAHLMHLHAGDCFTIDDADLALAGQKVVVLRATTDHKSASVTLEVRSETDAKHPFALGQTDQAPPSPSLSAVDPRFVPPPVALDWETSIRPPAPDGTSQPVIIVVGRVETSDVASVIIEHGPSEDGPWTLAYTGAVSADGRYQVPGLEPGQPYWIAIRYVARNGSTSERLVQGPVVPEGLVADDVIIPGGRRISEQFPPTVDLLTLTSDARRASGTLIREALERWNRTRDEKIASIEREDVIKVDLVETRETLTLANDGALALIESVETASIGRDLAETATRQTQISVVAGNVASLQLTTGTIATNLSAETYQRTLAVSAVQDSVAVVQGSVTTLTTALSAETETRNTQYSATQGTLAAYDSRITTATTQSSANATAIFNLGVSLAGVSGTITTLQSAQVDLSGRVNLLYGFALNAGGRIAGMYAANNGSISVIDFEFDVFRIWSGSASVPMFAVDSGNVYIAGNRVNTASLVSNAVTNGSSSRTTGNIGISAPTEVQSVSLTTAGGRVRVDFSVNLFSYSTSPQSVLGTIKRNGSAIWSGTIGYIDGEQQLYVQGPGGPLDQWVWVPGRLNATATAFFIDTDPAGLPGSYTYTFEVSCGVYVDARERSMALLELKR